MATDVVMPQMGESIAEGTIVRWIKKVGDQVARDEALFEISTDKVDAEIPSPAAGIVDEIRVREGETVPVNSVVAVIRQAGERMAAQPLPDGTTLNSAPASAPASSAAQVASGTGAGVGDAEPEPLDNRDDRIRRRSSPLVRRLVREYNVDLAESPGTGLAGRVTKRDVLGFVSRVNRVGSPATPAPGSSVQPLSVMRKKIAEHMVLSRRTSAHVHSVFEVDFSGVAKARETESAETRASGTKATYLAFIIRAAADALRAFPIVNASLDGDNIVYHQDVNIGMAVSLDWGLIVPVIRKADALDLLEVSRAVADLAARARSKQLKPDEVTGGTFTVTNPGAFGAMFGMPIINQPQVAILGVGNIAKRPVVVDDAVVVRLTGYLTLGYDHRLIDGAVADQFMSHLKRRIEEP